MRFPGDHQAQVDSGLSRSTNELAAGRRDLAQRSADLAAATSALDLRIARRTGQLDAAKDELEAIAYAMAHNLRAPARHVDALAQLLEESAPKLDAKQTKWLALMRASSQRQASMIDDIVDYLRLGNMPLDMGPVDMNAEAARAVKRMAPAWAGRVEWKIADLPQAHGDVTLVRSILFQLVANATKFSARQASPCIEIGVQTTEAGVTYLVRDNGVGFDPSRANKMFKLFEKMHGHDEFTGAGLGLALVRRLVSRLDGQVWARSAPGRGATFHFTLGHRRDESN